MKTIHIGVVIVHSKHCCSTGIQTRSTDGVDRHIVEAHDDNQCKCYAGIFHRLGARR